MEAFFLAGPTAAGKSDVALCLAERLEGEIISVDSMQVYCGLNVGTAKPSLGDRQRIPHHLVDIIRLEDTFDAAQFVRLAQTAVREIQARGRVPIFCGGSGLYFKAYLEGLGQAPAPQATLRLQLEATPLPELLAELQRRDPLTYQRIDQRNPRRVIRSLEVIRQTGHPFSEQRAPWTRGHISEAQLDAAPWAPACFFGLARSAPDLHQRIETRVNWMFQQGLVEETRQLLALGLAQNRVAMQAIGYRQAVEFLRGQRSLAETISLVKQRTRQFAKRQMTWFRRQARLTWVPCAPEQTPEHIAEQLAGEYHQRRHETG